MLRAFLRNLVSGTLAVRLRRFVMVGALAAGVQMALLWAFVELVGVNYMLSALAAIEITIVLSYVLNNAWTFQRIQNTGIVGYLVGLCKTNLVRGTAIPLQLAVLFLFVEWVDVMYLVSNGIAIAISGVYRYVLDARWTWG